MAAFRAILVLVLGSAVACSAPRINTATDEEMKHSVAAVREALPSDQQARFDTALQILAFSQVDLAAVFTQPAALSSGKLEIDIKALLNGKTGAEVIAA